MVRMQGPAPLLLSAVTTDDLAILLSWSDKATSQVLALALHLWGVDISYGIDSRKEMPRIVDCYLIHH